MKCTCFWLEPPPIHELTLTQDATGVYQDEGPIILHGRRFRHAWLGYRWVLGFTTNVDTAHERYIFLSDQPDEDWAPPLREQLRTAATNMLGVAKEYTCLHVAELGCSQHGSYASSGPYLPAFRIPPFNPFSALDPFFAPLPPVNLTPPPDMLHAFSAAQGCQPPVGFTPTAS